MVRGAVRVGQSGSYRQPDEAGGEQHGGFGPRHYVRGRVGEVLESVTRGRQEGVLATCPLGNWSNHWTNVGSAMADVKDIAMGTEIATQIQAIIDACSPQ